jgi:hypothetical protein
MNSSIITCLMILRFLPVAFFAATKTNNAIACVTYNSVLLFQLLKAVEL